MSKTKNALVGAALMCTTALVPVEAHAMPPVTAFVGALFAGAGLAGAFVASAATLGITSALGVTLYAIGVSLVVGVGLLKLAQSLMPKPQTPDPSNRMVNFAQPLTFFETVYGRARKGGPIAYTNFGNNQRRVVIIFAAHRVQGYEQWWLDEWAVSLSGNTVTTSPPGSLAQIHPRVGTVPQSLLPCVSAFSELTSAHDFAGLAVAELVANKPAPEAFTDNYPRGREWVLTALVAGRNDIFDPRTGTTGFTDNAALVIAHWITTYMGKTVNWDEVAVEANECDVNVQTRYDGTQKKWTLNGVFNDAEDDEIVRAQMGLACDAFFYERADGQVGFKVGRYYEPTEALDENDFYSVTVSDGENALDAVNETVINYVERAREWRESACGPWVHDPAGRRTRDSISAFFINHHNQAVRVAKRISRAQHARYSLRGIIKYVGHQIVGERFVRVRHSELGIDEVFEVQSLTRSEDGMTFEIEAISVEPEDFQFNHLTEEPTRPDSSESQEGDTNYDPTSITALSQPVSGVPSIIVEWDGAYDSTTHIVRWAPSGTTDWVYSPVIAAGIGSYTISPLVDGQTYLVQVAATGGVTGRLLSAYLPSPALSVQVVSNPTAPANLLSFSASFNVDQGRVEVAILPPNDPNYYATRVYRSETNSFGTADLINTEYGAPNVADTYLDTNVTSGLTYYYWGVPINSSGVPGNTSAVTSVTIP